MIRLCRVRQVAIAADARPCKGRERSARPGPRPPRGDAPAGPRAPLRIKADAQAYAAMLEEAREHQRERRSNGQGPRMRELDRTRYWRLRAVGRGLTLA